MTQTPAAPSRIALAPTAVLLAAALLLTGCSADDRASSRPADDVVSGTVGTVPSPAPATPKPSAIDAAPDPSTVPTTRDDLIDAATPSGSASGGRGGGGTAQPVRRNEVGEVWELDAAAAAACAQAEFALTALDGGKDPQAPLKRAVSAAGPSRTTSVKDAAAKLVGSRVGRADVVSFLTVCTEKGYEL